MNGVTTGYRWFKAMADGGAVTRYHSRRMARTQTNAEHQWGVAMMLWAAGVANAQLLGAALVHDVHEYDTGDSPANAKWANPALGQMLDDLAAEFDAKHGISLIELTDRDRLLLRWADLAELIHHCIVESQMGNQYAREIIRNGLKGLKRILDAMVAQPDDYGSVPQVSADLVNEAQVFLY